MTTDQIINMAYDKAYYDNKKRAANQKIINKMDKTLNLISQTLNDFWGDINDLKQQIGEIDVIQTEQANSEQSGIYVKTIKPEDINPKNEKPKVKKGNSASKVEKVSNPT